ncbi:mercuric resistance operon regulatory protein [Stenotrophomonas sp. SKA14]|uniref:MerR family transcriptional regulator n=1 Tax=Stenotrophomonas TaxID=40323 RepID=UPI00018FEC12|nr:MerR family transcriptional regulator [Stenotrophomonas sp. SKA14]EED37201.1 mercuric resistance operon regulatory protein [Stenotrophomonas sp. SKA14]
MKIGELARRTGLAASRIRFYEDAGLLVVQRQANGYRDYPEQAVLLLELIIGAQRAGFSLEEIRALLPPDMSQWQHDALITMLRRKVADIEALQLRLAQSRAHLLALIEDIQARPDGIDCAANSRRVLDRVQRGDLARPTLAAGDGALLRPGRRRRRAGSD